jgi:tetratricopeptide (TPR) repeat protein
MKYWILFLICCVACQPKKSDEGLNLTDEQLKEILRQNSSTPVQNSGDIIYKLEENLKIDSTNLENLYNLAFVYCTKCLQDLKIDTLSCIKAIQYFQKVKNLDKNYRDAKAYYNSHLCYKKMGNRESALENMNIFVENNLNNKTLRINIFLKRAELYIELGRREEACRDLKNALKSDTTGYYKLSDKISCK